MANNIYSPGPQAILSSSAAAAGNWYRLHPAVRNVTFMATQTGSSVGVAVGATVYVEASNDGINPIATTLGTITLSGASPQVDGFTSDAHWEYVRFNTSSLTTGTIAGVASAQFPK